MSFGHQALMSDLGCVGPPCNEAIPLMSLTGFKQELVW